MSQGVPRSPMTAYGETKNPFPRLRVPEHLASSHGGFSLPRLQDDQARQSITIDRSHIASPVIQLGPLSSAERLPLPSQLNLPSIFPHRRTYDVDTEPATEISVPHNVGTPAASSYPPSPRAIRPSENGRLNGREQLPSLSQVLGLQARANGATDSPQWRSTPSIDTLSSQYSPTPSRSEAFGPRASPSFDPSAYRLSQYGKPAQEETLRSQRSSSQLSARASSRPDFSRRPSMVHPEGERPGRQPTTTRTFTPWSPQSDRQDDRRRSLSSGQFHPPHQEYTSRAAQSSQPTDAIGPMIWTGTHFLPRFVGERNVPGEGLCFFYDDGTHCKTIIEGEMVNAHWGVTKAGKPRKRLAVACRQCREKKIKCDPDWPKCVLCEKFGRDCQFGNAHRETRGSPESSVYNRSDSQAVPSAAASVSGDGRDDPDHYVSRDVASPNTEKSASITNGKRKAPSDHGRLAVLANEADKSEDLSENAEYGVKRLRTSPADLHQAIGDFRPAEAKIAQATRPSFPNEAFSHGVSELPSTFEWQTDPYHVDPRLVSDLINHSFDQINSAIFYIFPRRSFLRWLQAHKKKSQDEITLVYTLLTMASDFSTHPQREKLSAVFARVAEHALENQRGRCSMQLVQSRLLLAQHYLASDRLDQAWEWSGAALRAAIWLKLNLEPSHNDTSSRDTFVYGLDSFGNAECRRRTFWAAYLMDRYNGFYTGNVMFSHDEDIFLRLPCDEKSYEEQVCVDNPMLQDRSRGIGKVEIAAGLGLCAYLVLVSSIWGDVVTNIYRFSHLSHDVYEERYEDFYEKTRAQLCRWHASLPADKCFSRENLDACVRSGTGSCFILTHTLYHLISMKVNRDVRMRCLSSGDRSHRIRQAHMHATDLLHMANAIVTINERIPSASDHLVLNPLVGYAITYACDILSARGRPQHLPNTISLLQYGLLIFQELQTVWPSVLPQRKGIARRLSELNKLAISHTDGAGDASPALSPSTVPRRRAVFTMSAPIAADMITEEDLIYSTPVNVSEDALLLLAPQFLPIY